MEPQRVETVILLPPRSMWIQIHMLILMSCVVYRVSFPEAQELKGVV